MSCRVESFEKAELDAQRERAVELSVKGLDTAVIVERLASMGPKPSDATVRKWTRGIGRPRKCAKRVLRSDGAVFDSMKLAGEAVGCSPCTIKRHIGNKVPYVGYGYSFAEVE